MVPVVLVLLKVAGPGLAATVHDPEAGKPERGTLPVLVLHVGCTGVPAVGVDGSELILKVPLTPALAAEVAAGVVTVIELPDVVAGVVTVIVVELTTVRPEPAFAPPKFTAVAPVKLVPVIVICVCPGQRARGGEAGNCWW